MARRYNKEVEEKARATAKELQEQGVHHIDFMRFWYQDETQSVTQAFDAQGEPIKDSLPPSLHHVMADISNQQDKEIRTHKVYMYSPSAHNMLSVGEVKGQEAYTVEAENVAAYEDFWSYMPVLSVNYEDLLAALTWQPDIDVAILREYMQHDASEVRRAIAANPNIPEDVAVMLANDSDKEVRKMLALSPALSEHVQRKLSQDDVPEVRIALASSRYTSSHILVEIWEKLVPSTKDEDLKVAYAAISNPNIPFDVLFADYSSGNLSQAANIANHSDISTEALEAVLEQKLPDNDVKQRPPWHSPYEPWTLILNNQDLSFSQLLKLYKRFAHILRNKDELTRSQRDEAENICHYSAFKLRHKTMPDYEARMVKLVKDYPLSEENTTLYFQILQSPRLSWEVICQLGLNTEQFTRAFLARDDVPRAFFEDFLQIHAYPSPSLGEMYWLSNLRWRVKDYLYSRKHKSTEEWFANLRGCLTSKDYFSSDLGDLQDLIDDTEPCPTEILNECSQHILAQTNDDVDAIEQLKYVAQSLVLKTNTPHAALAQHPHYIIRKTVAASEVTPENILAQLSEDEAWQVRMETARNRFTPRACLEKLAQDEHHVVRNALLQNFAAPRYLLQRMSEQPSATSQRKVSTQLILHFISGIIVSVAIFVSLVRRFYRWVLGLIRKCKGVSS